MDSPYRVDSYGLIIQYSCRMYGWWAEYLDNNRLANTLLCLLKSTHVLDQKCFQPKNLRCLACINWWIRKQLFTLKLQVLRKSKSWIKVHFFECYRKINHLKQGRRNDHFRFQTFLLPRSQRRQIVLLFDGKVAI